jgi:hypothetical protein
MKTNSKEEKKCTCVLAVLQAGMTALETLAFSATFPEFQLRNPTKKNVDKKLFGHLTSSYKIAKDAINSSPINAINNIIYINKKLTASFLHLKAANTPLLRE